LGSFRRKITSDGADTNMLFHACDVVTEMCVIE